MNTQNAFEQITPQPDPLAVRQIPALDINDFENYRIQEFAKQYGLRTKRDSCGELFILCRHGQIYHHGSDTFGVMVLNDETGRFESGSRSTPRIWGNIRRTL